MIPNAPKDMDKIIVSHRQLAILKALHKLAAQRTNERVMAEWLDELALGGTRDVVRIALQELAQMAVIKTDMRGFDGDTMVFWLTERGLDYLEFRTTVETLPRIGPSYSSY